MTNIEFIKKHHSEDFSIFKNKTLVIRGFKDGSPIVFQYDYINDSINNHIYKKFIMGRDNNIVEETIISIKDSSKTMIDDNDRYLVTKFCSYHIYSLAVKSNNDVIIKISPEKGVNTIIRHECGFNIPEEWKKICENWYELQYMSD